MSTILSVDLTNPLRGDTGLFIEQGEPDPGDGTLSRSGMYLAILALIDGEAVDEHTECTDDIGVELFVYRYDLSQKYTLMATHGTLSDKVVQDSFVFTERVHFNMGSSKRLRYPNFGFVEGKWLGNKVWNSDAEVLSNPPTVTTDIDSITTDIVVYGTYLITYKINRDKYGLSIPPREDVEENKYSVVSYAVILNNSPEWLVVDVPEVVEDTGYLCTGGFGQVSINPGDDPGQPYADHDNAEKHIDYCSGEVLRDDTK